MARFNRRRQSGIALLMAILIVVAATAISVSMIHDESFLIRKTSRLQLLDRASLYALGLEDWARLILQRDREDNQVDHLGEDWAVTIPGLPIEAGYLAGFMLDEQSKFNLNSLLASQESLKRFTRLCNNLEVDPIFIPALLDWIDADFDVRYPDGAEESYDDYRIANRAMVDISELMLVKNVTAEMFETLKPHITALPVGAKLNVNTMSEEIFLSLDENLNLETFLKERDEDAFSSVDDFVTRLAVAFNEDDLATSSEYFRAYGKVVQADLEYDFETLFNRDSKGTTTVLQRSIGQF